MKQGLGTPARNGLTASLSAVCICPYCDTVQNLPAVPPGAAAHCLACGATLRSSWPRSLDFTLLAASTAMPLFVLGSVTDLAMVERAGRQSTAGLLSGPEALASQGLWSLALLVGFVTVVAPALSTGLLMATLVGVRLRCRRRWLVGAFAWRNRLRPWSMIEVFLVGYFVAYAKLGALVQMEPGPAFFALLAFMICTVAIDAVLDHEAIWAAIAPEVEPAADPAHCCGTCGLACASPQARPATCPRCGRRLHRRKPGSASRTAALALAALILYVPANLYPVLTVELLGRGAPSTILGGVWELIAAGEYPLALIVFLASVTVPVLKILGLAIMLAVVSGLLPTRQQRRLTVLYRVVAAIGRWSMIDIFMEAILASLVKFGTIATILAGPGAVAFAAVVVMTIFAAEGFDPRLMWDRART